jgi:hypothetical protein
MNNTKSLVMSRASELRGAGVDPSKALSEAWAEYSNPYEEALVEVPEYNPPTRRRRTTETAGGGSVILLLGAAVVAYYLIKKEWPWQTIQQISRRQQLAKRKALETAKNTGSAIGSASLIPISPNGTSEHFSLIVP